MNERQENAIGVEDVPWEAVHKFSATGCKTLDCTLRALAQDAPTWVRTYFLLAADEIVRRREENSWFRAELEAERAENGRLTSWLRTIRGEAHLLVREDDIEVAGAIVRMVDRALAPDAGTRKEEA